MSCENISQQSFQNMYYANRAYIRKVITSRPLIAPMENIDSE